MADCQLELDEAEVSRTTSQNASALTSAAASAISGPLNASTQSCSMTARIASRRSSFVSAIVNLASGQVSIRLRRQGPNSATATACSAGAHAIGDSFKIIQRGDADVMICGGAESAITPMSVAGFACACVLFLRATTIRSMRRGRLNGTGMDL